jgi:F-type H+-transporting ATPase subunit delta
MFRLAGRRRLAAAAADVAQDKPQLVLNFYIPSQDIVEAKPAHMVTVPGVAREMGVLAQHVPTMTELRPGTVQIHYTPDKVERYFVSGGFVFVHPNSVMDIAAVEAVPLEQLDPQAVKSAFLKAQKDLADAKEDAEKVEAEIAYNVFHAMNYALETFKP